MLQMLNCAMEKSAVCQANSAKPSLLASNGISVTNQSMCNLLWNMDRAVVPPRLGAVVPAERNAREDKSLKSR